MSTNQFDSTDQQVWEIDSGWDVFGSDGEKVGDVQDVQAHYITVSKGFFFPTERYIPVNAITSVDDDRVYLNVSKDEIDNHGWDVVPDRDADNYAGTTGHDVETGAVDRVGDHDTLRVQLAEEQLDVDKHQVHRGSVRVRKDVVEELESLNLPLREEKIVIKRHPVDRTTMSGDTTSTAFQETEIEIPIRGEEIDISRRTVVREEVDISKAVRDRTEHVSNTVRREELHVNENP